MVEVVVFGKVGWVMVVELKVEVEMMAVAAVEVMGAVGKVGGKVAVDEEGVEIGMVEVARVVVGMEVEGDKERREVTGVREAQEAYMGNTGAMGVMAVVQVKAEVKEGKAEKEMAALDIAVEMVETEVVRAGAASMAEVVVMEGTAVARVVMGVVAGTAEASAGMAAGKAAAAALGATAVATGAGVVTVAAAVKAAELAALEAASVQAEVREVAAD